MTTMAIKDDDNKEDLAPEQGAEEPAHEEPREPSSDDGPAAVSPTQLGHKRFVYAAYFAGAVAIAFMVSKLMSVSWAKLSNWKPALGEPHEEIVMPIAAVIGALSAVYFWYRTRARQLAEQVAEELSKVTWPSRTEVTNSTVVVIVTTIVSTIFFALMDRFWSFLTNLVYGT